MTINGIYNLPEAEYRSLDRLNPSSLAAGILGVGEVDPCRIRDAMMRVETPRAQASQDRMDRGTLFHMAILEPDRLGTDIAVWDGARRVGAVWDTFCDDNADKLIVRKQDYDDVMEAAIRLRMHPIVRTAIEGIEPEVAILSTDMDGTIETKGRVDCIHRGERRIVDIKTTDAGIDAKSIERTIRQWHYREKMAMYRRWVAQETSTPAEDWRCYNLFISMSPPFGVREVKFTSSALEWGECVMLDAMHKYAKALKDGFKIYGVRDVMDVAPWECEGDDDGDIDFS